MKQIEEIIQELEHSTCYRCIIKEEEYYISYIFSHNNIHKVTLHISKVPRRYYWLEVKSDCVSSFILTYINRIIQEWGIKLT